MLNISYLRILILLLVASVVSVDYVQGQTALGVKAGSTGFGAEVTTSLSNKFNARLAGSFFSYSGNGTYDEEEVGIDYDVTGDVTSIGGLVDYYPFNRGLKLSAGLFYHDFMIDGGAIPNESYSIDEKEFAPEKLGSLNAQMDYESNIVPYGGLGFGNPVGPGGRFKVNLELGALYTNSPRVTMAGEGMIAPTADQDQDLEDGLSDFKVYPVLNLGFSYRIN